MAVKWIEVESSNIAAIAYIKEGKQLMVQFNNGAVYAYSDVPEDVYQEFQDATSKGRFFAEHIKDKYETEKVS